MIGSVKRATAAFLCFLAIVAVATAGAYYVWQRTTNITVTEPFAVNSNLPTEASLPPGSYIYWVNVTNNGGIPYNATLTYTASAVNVTYTISPANGTTVTVPAHQTFAFSINITIVLLPEYPSGALTINWAIQRGAVK